ncbi:type VI secretion system protein TssL, short form [Pseudomonas sp. NPDC087029]|uniref:type VI secretion system protein TssL, short form n=1 Tax=Pseudomonas sp. NPDC087029 TaxID=3364433 RepID=UPI003801EBCF
MKRIEQPFASRLNIDELLQDTYLLVIELRQGAKVHSSPELWNSCVEQVERAREALVEAGLDARNIDFISHAQCALLDETVLARVVDEAHAAWARESLQARFFNTHQAGEFVYQEIRSVLAEPSGNPLVLTVFQRVLMLGFLGRYRDANDPERQQLLAALTSQVAPLDLTQGLVVRAGKTPSRQALAWLHSPVLHIVAASVVLAGVWWGLDRVLAGALASLLPGLV